MLGVTTTILSGPAGLWHGGIGPVIAARAGAGAAVGAAVVGAAVVVAGAVVACGVVAVAQGQVPTSTTSIRTRATCTR